MCRGSAFAYRNAAVPLGKDIGGVIAIVFGTGECDADMIAFMDQLMQRAISHDLRSPLAAIAAACCALSDGWISEIDAARRVSPYCSDALFHASTMQSENATMNSPLATGNSQTP